MSAANPGNVPGLLDIHLPDPVGWWPLAPGYWVLLALLVIGLVLLGLWLTRRHQQKAYRRAALAHIEELSLAYAQQHNPGQLASGLNRVLKRTALQAYPQEQIAQLQDEDWLNFLDSKQPTATSVFNSSQGQSLLTLAYRGDVASAQPDQLIALCRNWVETHV